MNAADAQRLIRRMRALWKIKADEDADREWLLVLRPLETTTAEAALDEMRDTLMFPPTVADLRSAYYVALALAGSDRPALPPGDEGPSESLRDRYGENQKDWVYCWRCDMALTLEERDSSHLSGYDESRGMYHHRCPKNGAAPHIPAGERMARDEYLGKRKIAIGRNAEPLPYRG
jgi:hypothetical protein